MTLIGTVRENKKVPPKQHAACQGKACLLDQFLLPSWCNGLFMCSKEEQISSASIICAHDGRNQYNRNSQTRDNNVLQQNQKGDRCYGKNVGWVHHEMANIVLASCSFYNMVDSAGLASHIIYKKHNPRFRTKDQPRKFLKNLAQELCMSSTRSSSCLYHASWQSWIPPILGSCYFCRDQNWKQRKTRKSCVAYMQPVCNKHSASKTTLWSIICENY